MKLKFDDEIPEGEPETSTVTPTQFHIKDTQPLTTSEPTASSDAENAPTK